MAVRVSPSNPFLSPAENERRSTRPAQSRISSSPSLRAVDSSPSSDIRSAVQYKPPRSTSGRKDMPTTETRPPAVNNPPSYRSTASAQDRSTRSSGKKSRKGGVDVIDQLDITSGLYGGFHHDGPFDAASAHRNRNDARRPAPMAAFDPSALAPVASPPPSSADPSRSSSKLSARAQATLAAMDDNDATFLSKKDNGYSPLANESFELSRESSPAPSPDVYPPSRPRRGSAGSITLGYPVDERKTNAKGKAVAEAFGFVDAEAWEDYGRTYSKQQPRETVYRPEEGKLPKGLRAERAASVWDMEATLRAGKPVGAAPPLPPLPTSALDASHSRVRSTSTPMAYETTGNEPKRSKSLMQRIKKARKEPTVPISALGDEDAPAPSSAMRESPSARRNLGASGGIRREDISAPIATPPPVRPVDPFENAPSDSVLDDVLGYDDYPLGDDDLDNKETLSPLGRSQVSQNGRLAANGLDSPPLAGGSGLGRKPSLVQRMKGLRTR